MSESGEPGKDNAGDSPQPAPKAIPAVKVMPPKQPTGRRKWLFRLAALILVPGLVLGLLELGLRAFSFGDSTDFFLDGSELEGPNTWIDNPRFARWVFPRSLRQAPEPIPFVLPKSKLPGTYRIFVLGESAAMGFPDPSTSFARVLGVLLRDRFPQARFEIVNTALVAINSHVALQIARQCADFQPDLLVVHLGNNEVIGPFGAAGVLGPFTPSLNLIRANLAIKRTRLGQLFDRLRQGVAQGNHGPENWEGMEMFLGSQMRGDDPKLQRIYDHFRRNLEDICRVGAGAGIPVVLCSIPVNLRDSAPFGSLHRPELDTAALARWEAIYQEGVRLEEAKRFDQAIRCFEEAEQIDATFADLPFRLGRCYEAQGETARAARRFAQARDLDVLRFRSDTTINATVRNVAAERAAAGVHLADAERAFAQQSSAEAPGENLFLEHVHMNFAGNYLLGRTVFETVAPLLPKQLSAASTDASRNPEPIAEQECGARLAVTEWTEWKFAQNLTEQLMQNPPFTFQLDRAERTQRWRTKLAAMRERLQAGGTQDALKVYEKAVPAADGDWMIRVKYAQLLIECGNWPAAYEQYQRALGSLRHNFIALQRLGNLEVTMGLAPSAERHLREALRIAPEEVESNVGLAEALERQGKLAEAEAILVEQARKNSHKAFAMAALGRFLYRNGRLDEAHAQLTEAVQREPNIAAPHVDLAMTLLKQGRREEAIQQFETALQLDPNWQDVREQLADLKQKGEGHPPGRQGSQAP